MPIYKPSEARASFFKLMEEVSQSHEPVHVKGKEHSVVMLAEEDYRSMQETLYILSIPGMREELKASMGEPLEHSSKKLEW